MSPGRSSHRGKRDNRHELNVWPGSYALLWIVPALTTLYLKYVLMAGTQSYTAGGFAIAARSLGKEDGFRFWGKFSFFQMDIVAALVVPAALLILVRFLPASARLACFAIVSAAVTVALYAQLRAFQEVGQFISFQMFWTAFSWGWHEPGAYASYLGVKGLSTLAAVAALVLGFLFWISKKHGEHPEIVRELHVEQGAVTLKGLFLFCLLPVTIVCWLPQVGSTPYHSSVLVKAMRAYWGGHEVPTAEFAGLSTQALFSRYHELTGSPAAHRDTEYWGKAPGDNVIFFVLETMPARFLPSDGPMADLPNLRRLREQSFVALEHQTTFPRTHEAVFSLLSSWYPSDVTRTFEEQHPDIKIPGIMRDLAENRYYTAVYSPMRRWHSLDEEMFRNVGVQHQVYPPDSVAPPDGRRDLLESWEQTRVDRDLATLDLMKHDLERCMRQQQPFAAVFLPQISHLPYPELEKGFLDKDVRAQAREILAREDAWLGQVIRLLDQYHQLDKTIIVITGDHGVRSSHEDAAFAAGMIDEYSFHVPLLIYAPNALHHPVTIPWVTSHIDVAPTVLDLLGINRDFMEGDAIWNSELANRRTFFFANALFGADGYYSDGRFYMRNSMSDSVYEGQIQHFRTSDIVPDGSAGHAETSRSVERMVGLQQVLATHFTQTDAVRNHIFSSARGGQ